MFTVCTQDVYTLHIYIYIHMYMYIYIYIYIYTYIVSVTHNLIARRSSGTRSAWRCKSRRTSHVTNSNTYVYYSHTKYQYEEYTKYKYDILV